MSATHITSPEGCGPVEAAMRTRHIAARARLWGSGYPAPVDTEGVEAATSPHRDDDAPLVEHEGDAIDTSSISGIVRSVCRKHQVSRAQLVGRSRTDRATICRWECCYELRKHIRIDGRQISLAEIARHVGVIDHTSVHNAIEQHCRLNGLPIPVSEYQQSRGRGASL